MVKPERKLDSWEDVCFICKDYGELLLCDFSGCCKAYHIDCLGKSDIRVQDLFICECHACSVCKQCPLYYCIGCPRSYCGSCMINFRLITRTKGLCDTCLELAVAVEKEGVNPEDLMLFKNYYAQLEKDGLNLECIFPCCFTLQLYLSSDRVAFSDLHEPALESFESRVWYYNGPQGNMQGPFSLEELLMSKKAGRFPKDIDVCKNGHRGIPLNTLLAFFGYF